MAAPSNMGRLTSSWCGNMVDTWQEGLIVSSHRIGYKVATHGIIEKVTCGRYMAVMASRMGDQRSEVESYFSSK